MLSPSAEAVEPLRHILIKYAYERRDVWPSRKHAYQDLKSKRRCERWDPRVLDLYIVLHPLVVLLHRHPNDIAEIWTPDSPRCTSPASTL
jgi:hypothetical protein